MVNGHCLAGLLNRKQGKRASSVFSVFESLEVMKTARMRTCRHSPGTILSARLRSVEGGKTGFCVRVFAALRG